MKSFDEILKLHSENILPTYGRYPVAFAKGEGCKLWDTEGKEYIDFASGIGVNSVGHSHPKWVEAVCSQAGMLAHVSNLFHTEPSAVLARKLCEISGMKGVFFSNSGAESVEGVIKTARKYSGDKYGPGRHTIITLENSFHGRTMAALTATGQPEKFHKHFHPFVQGFRYVPANDFAALEAEAKAKDVCALLIEFVQGEGGIMPLDAEYVKKAAEFCKKNDWLLIADEVQTGIGRTGEWFAFQNYGVKPDILAFAKGIAGGLPLGGFLVGEKTRATLGAGDHGTTYGGNPICCSAALAVLEILETALPLVKEKGAYIREKITKMNLPYVKEIRGAGLMLGIKLEGTAHTDAVKKLLDAGLVALVAGADILRFLPPLTISMEEIDAGLHIIEKVFKEG
ncbi:MAG: aspartate aminotransferase family protein [Defluviitaleaceae bacterium]|nr:aspartate aminotransferase family protein [Defluviitaleaceae bacterium]